MGISRTEALDSLRSDDLIGLGMEADAVRRRLHPEGVVSYAVVGRLRCAGGSVEALVRRAAEMAERGSSGFVLERAAESGMDELVRLVAALRRELPASWISGLNAGEVRRLSESSGEDVAQGIARLLGAGWNSLAGDAPDSAADRAEVGRWLALHEA
ncbi:MAG: hypothetical protein M3O02_00125, partial [Acidobacteriota bacterium]|nr:hypothetical protein [Acidobacteriota bacterium]